MVSWGCPGEFKYLVRALVAAERKPTWVIFLGDVDIDHKPQRAFLAPLRRDFPSVRFAFIHGNHDADSYEHWAMLHDCGDALAFHSKVAKLGESVKRIWMAVSWGGSGAHQAWPCLAIRKNG